MMLPVQPGLIPCALRIGLLLLCEKALFHVHHTVVLHKHAAVLTMSCSWRLRPESSTKRFARIASDRRLSGSNSQSVDHHLFRRAIYDNIGSPGCFANGPESNCPCRKSSDASSDCKGKACCRICSIRWSMPSGLRRRLSPMSRAMLNASPRRALEDL